MVSSIRLLLLILDAITSSSCSISSFIHQYSYVKKNTYSSYPKTYYLQPLVHTFDSIDWEIYGLSNKVTIINIQIWIHLINPKKGVPEIK